MLARLDEQLAPARAAVDREGTVLRIEASSLEPEAAARAAEMVGEMGYVASPLADAPTVGRWFGAREVDDLSREEADVLARRLVDRMTDQRVIDAAEGVLDALRAALLEAFREAARTGGEVDVVRLDLSALEGVLDARQRDAARAWLDDALGRA